MDPYSLKRDNRKKFQDKQRLKHRHATPSDRKYRALNRQEKEGENSQSNEDKDEEEVELEIPSNEARYHEDITMAFGDAGEEERNSIASKRLRDILKEKAEQEKFQDNLPQNESSQARITTKGLQTMDIADLNQLLGTKNNTNLTPAPRAAQRNHQLATLDKQQSVESRDNRKNKESATSNVPKDLIAAQDFLDDLI
ncbi:hypothetical protein HG535_0B02620 [Zygotorulaspora mrakii]|uniref:Uncharacterized protein n=1 Tax=Zygotorulaspora mrakii TaxID=42260 RepID=A0A7H9AYD8_ZYGMR|nr:uncharacterized protein HG535_0B02620 [Zygotorulaspora mrakii]QLG71223.1 hypothetical protein HG535_0B02620 [Zygotorulaspora mrakii]